MFPSIRFSILFIFPIFVGIYSNSKEEDNVAIIEGKLIYNKEGDLEFSFERAPTMNAKAKSNLSGILFFEQEKLNRQVFNIDICIDFYDRNVTKNSKLMPKNRIATVILCYDGNPDQEIAPNNHLDSNSKRELNILAEKCGADRNDIRLNNRRGIKLAFEPDSGKGIYKFYSVVDSAIYEINITYFEKDEVRVFRQNNVPKFCFRLEMGRMPPDDDELFDQQLLIQQMLDGALMEIAANNRSDNLTKLFEQIPELVLKVDDVANWQIPFISIYKKSSLSTNREEFILRTVDLTNSKKEMLVADQEKRIARNFYGTLYNETKYKAYEKKSKLDEFCGNKSMDHMISKKFYADFVKKLKTDENYKLSSKNLIQMELFYESEDLHFLNISFNGGNISPCRTEWVDLQKFQMERDFFHEAIHDEFDPIHIAYTVGLVGWKKEGDQGFGPGYKKKGKIGPAAEDIGDLQSVLHKTEGFTELDDRLKEKFADWDKNLNETFQILDEYSIPLQLNDEKPLGLITVKQLVFICSEFTFNLPHVASFTQGIGL